MDQRAEVLAGVTKALIETGEDLKVTRVTTVKDPNKPTQPGVETSTSWVGRGYIYPEVKWEPTTQTRVTTTMVIFDKRSFVDDLGQPVINFRTELGDFITEASGKRYKLLTEQNPRLLGGEMAYIHPLAGA